MKKEKILNLVQQLSNTEPIKEVCHQQLKDSPMPSVPVLSEIVDLCRSVLFPGYYFAFNDFIHTRLTGDVYSQGGYGIKASTLYKKRYRFGGGFNIDYQKFASPITELNPLDYNTIWVNWQHTPESRGNSD